MKNITNNGNNKPWVKIVVVRYKFVKNFTTSSNVSVNLLLIKDLIITINIYDKL